MKWKEIPILFILFLFGWVSHAQDPIGIISAGKPAIRTYTDQDGLPQNTVEGIAIDQKGYLWVATQDGVVRYNGHDWQTFHMPEREISNWVRCLLVSRKGALWAGRDGGGVVRREPDGSWTRFDRDQGLPHGRVWCLSEPPEPVEGLELVAGTGYGPAYWDGEKWIAPVDIPAGLRQNVLSIAWTRNQESGLTMWLGTEKGLWSYAQNGWRFHDASTGVPETAINCLSVVPGQNGNEDLMAGTQLGLVVVRSGNGRLLGQKEGLPEAPVTALAFLGGNAQVPVVLVGTESGVAIAVGNRAYAINSSGFPNRVVRSMHVQRFDGTDRILVWIGTFGGLVRMANGTWSTYDTATGLPDNIVFATLDSPRTGAFWAGTFGGIVRFHEGRWHVFGESDGLPSGTTTFSLLESDDPDGNISIWAGLRGAGVGRYSGNTWKLFGIRDGLPDNMVYSLTRFPDTDEGTIWAGTRKGIARFRGDRWQVERVGAGTPDPWVTCMVPGRTPEGEPELWIGSRGQGIARYRNGKWIAYDQNSGLDNLRISGMMEYRKPDGRRQIWAATFGGVYVLDPDVSSAQWELLQLEDVSGSETFTYYSIVADRRDRIYLFSQNGVMRLTPENEPDDQMPEYDVYAFTTGDGLPSNGCTQNSASIDSSGRIWTGTVAGLAMLDADQMVIDRQAKPLIIEQTMVGGREVDLEGMKLAYDTREIVIQYALLNYYREEDTRFRTRLVGLESEPGAWSQDPKREYPVLPAGTYTFQVWARDYTGNESGPVELSFTVLKAPWETGWAYLLYALLLMGMVVLAIRIRIRALERRTELLSRMVHERTRDLEEANLALRDQSLTDPLTGLRNRRFLTATIQESLAQIVRTRRDISSERTDRVLANVDIAFLMVDIDHFKEVNDQHGHPAGDAVLRDLAVILNDCVRSSDSVVRWGGEEFLVVARSTERTMVSRLAERIRSAVAAHSFQVGEAQAIHCTCSIGFACFPMLPDLPDLFSWKDMISVADQCLYTAKRSGRNVWVGLLGRESRLKERGEEIHTSVHFLMKNGLVDSVTSSSTDLNWIEEA